MRFLNQNKSYFVFISLFCSCASTSYQVANRDGRRIELSVTPDRVVLECEYTSENREIPYGFMIHVLDDENTVTDVTQMNTLGKEDCDNRISRIGRILKTGRRVYIAGHGDLNEPRKTEKWMFTFPGHGTFRSNGRFLQFAVIANENGLCFDAQMGDEKPCPDGVDFPIRERR